MANVHRFVSDADAKATERSAGIGTEATRGKGSGNTERAEIPGVWRKKSHCLYSLGREVIGLTPNELKRPRNDRRMGSAA